MRDIIPYMKQYITKADVILLIALIAFGLAATAVLAARGNDSSAAKVVIKSRGSLFASYSLSEDVTINVPSDSKGGSDYNVVTIKGGSVLITEASCHNQVCVHHAPISRHGETLVCLPNRLVVSIEKEDGGGYDSITS